MNAPTAKPIRVLGVVQNFRCLGGKCPMTCCAHWNIEVDDITASKLARSSFPLRDGKISCDGLQRVDRASPVWFAQRDAQGNCAFLNQRKECEIQTQWGHDGLPLTCRGFPRHQRVEAQHVEVSASAGCPETARLILQDPLAFAWFQNEPAWLAGYRPIQKLADSPQPDGFHAMLRRQFLELLDQASRPLTQRLLGVALLAQRADEISQHDPRVRATLEAFANTLMRAEDGQPPFAEISSLPSQLSQVFPLVSSLLGAHANKAGSALGSLLRRRFPALPASRGVQIVDAAPGDDHASTIASREIPALLFHTLARRAPFEQRHGRRWQELEEKMARYFLVSEALSEYASAELFALWMCLLPAMVKMLVVMQWESGADEDRLIPLTTEAFAATFRELYHNPATRQSSDHAVKAANAPLLNLSATLLRI